LRQLQFSYKKSGHRPGEVVVKHLIPELYLQGSLITFSGLINSFVITSILIKSL
jgi:hypothetical protein